MFQKRVSLKFCVLLKNACAVYYAIYLGDVIIHYLVNLCCSVLWKFFFLSLYSIRKSKLLHVLFLLLGLSLCKCSCKCHCFDFMCVILPCTQLNMTYSYDSSAFIFVIIHITQHLLLTNQHTLISRKYFSFFFVIVTVTNNPFFFIESLFSRSVYRLKYSLATIVRSGRNGVCFFASPNNNEQMTASKPIRLNPACAMFTPLFNFLKCTEFVNIVFFLSFE